MSDENHNQGEVMFSLGGKTFKGKLIKTTSIPTDEVMLEAAAKMAWQAAAIVEREKRELCEKLWFGSIGIGATPAEASERFDRLSGQGVKLDLITGNYSMPAIENRKGKIEEHRGDPER